MCSLFSVTSGHDPIFGWLFYNVYINDLLKSELSYSIFTSTKFSKGCRYGTVTLSTPFEYLGMVKK